MKCTEIPERVFDYNSQTWRFRWNDLDGFVPVNDAGHTIDPECVPEAVRAHVAKRRFMWTSVKTYP